MTPAAPGAARLTYRPVDLAHADELLALAVDPCIRRYLLDGEVVSLDWARGAVAASDALFAEYGVGLWLARLADDAGDGGDLVGFCGFHIFPELSPAPQLLYALREVYAGRGLATEMARALVRAARARAGGWPVVEAAVDAPNGASIRVLEKLGFLQVGTLPGAFGSTHLYHLGVTARLTVDRTWEGAPTEPHAVVDLDFDLDALTITVEARDLGDPPPPAPPGPTPRLWEHEVVEVFLLGDDDRYLEVELGPHGHHLLLSLHGRREVVGHGHPIDYVATRSGARWRGVARVPAALLPPGLDRVNACAIHGQGDARRWLSWLPLPGPRPDFHQLERFAPIPLRSPGAS